MVAVDTGGTFSDLLAVDPDGVLTIAKTLSTVMAVTRTKISTGIPRG